jgi:hypothetical protein
VTERVVGAYAVYEDVDGQRRYWQGTGTRVWRAGEEGLRTAARFDDMYQARQAIASSRTLRRRLPQIGYEWVPAKVEQLVLLDPPGER